MFGLMVGAAAVSGLAAPAIAQRKKLRLGALRFTSHAASFIAFERGYFSDVGLDVEFKFFEAAQPMAVAIASGDIDYAVTAISGGLVSLAGKGAIKVIGGAVSEEKGIDGQKILASNAAHDAGLTDPSKLSDKIWGVSQFGSSYHYMGGKIEAAEHLHLSLKPLQKSGALIGALQSNQIDAMAEVPHIAFSVVSEGGAHIIGNISDFIPNYQVTTIFTSTTNAAKERDLTRSFLVGYSRGVADYNAAMVDKTAGDGPMNDVVDLIHKYVYADRPRDKAAVPIIKGSMRMNSDAALNVASVEDQLNWFKSGNFVDSSISIETLVDASYVKIIS